MGRVGGCVAGRAGGVGDAKHRDKRALRCDLSGDQTGRIFTPRGSEPVEAQRVPTVSEALADPRVFLRLPLEVLVGVRQQLGHLLADLDAALYLQTAATQRYQQPDRLMSVQEAARRLELKPARLYELIRQGRFTAVPVGKYRRIRESDLQSFMRTGTPEDMM